MSLSILYLYLNPKPRDRVQELTYAGIRRYAAAVGWDSVAWAEAGPAGLAAFLAAHRPVAGCIVECSDDNDTLPPRLFEGVPVVYLHATPSLYRARVMRVNADNDAMTRAAFRELASIRLDFEREGYIAAQMVGKARRGRDVPEDVIAVPPLMAVRRAPHPAGTPGW